MPAADKKKYNMKQIFTKFRFYTNGSILIIIESVVSRTHIIQSVYKRTLFLKMPKKRTPLDSGEPPV